MKYEEFLNSHEWRMTKADAEPYVYIWAWHRISGSMDYYIAGLIQDAVESKAPKTATYFDEKENRWHTIDEACGSTQERVTERIARGW